MRFKPESGVAAACSPMNAMVFILIFGSYGSGYDPQDFVYFQF